MKTVGIIGGLGPQTTSDFYMMLQELALNNGFEYRPNIVIDSVPLPLEQEADILSGEVQPEVFLPFLIESAKRLIGAGADFLVMPCNTLHILEEELTKDIDIPFISIVSATREYLNEISIKQVTLLATEHTIKSNLYTKPLIQDSITVICPNEEEQVILNRIIGNLVNRNETDKDNEEFGAIAEKYAKESVCVLACTDFHILPSAKGYIDTMEILAKSTIKHLQTN